MQEIERELRDFHDELLRLAKLPWRPNLNDGVQITAAPLWKLFRLPKWQKTLKETWQKLEKGDYDWAHLAMWQCGSGDRVLHNLEGFSGLKTSLDETIGAERRDEEQKRRQTSVPELTEAITRESS